jgi:Domain of unknown function (DUF4347)
MDLYFYFMANPKFGDPGGALMEEKLNHGDEITLVDSTQDLLAYVRPWVRPPISGRIKKMIISSHGVPGAFWIGKDAIEVQKNGPTHGLRELAALAPWFAHRALVVISGCEVANPDRESTKNVLLQTLAAMWPGVSVSGNTGYVADWKFGPFGGSWESGDQIVCTGTQCEEEDLSELKRRLYRP